MNRRLLFAALGLSALTSTIDVYAGDNKAAAEALFAAGRAAQRRGDVREACTKFRESHRLDPAPGTKLNLAACEADLGNLAAAWQYLESLAKTLPPDDPRLGLVRERLEKLTPRVPRVRFHAAERLPPGLTVRSGRFEITESGFGVPLPFDPGRHTFEVVAPDHERQVHSATLAEGETRVLEISAPPRLERPPPVEPQRAAGQRAPARVPREPPEGSAVPGAGPLHTWGIISLGVGGLALVSGAITGVLAIDRKLTMDDECDPDGCSREGQRASDTGETFATLSTASFVASGALAALGTALLLFNTKTPAKGASASLQVQPFQLTLVVRVGP